VTQQSCTREALCLRRRFRTDTSSNVIMHGLALHSPLSPREARTLWLPASRGIIGVRLTTRGSCFGLAGLTCGQPFPMMPTLE
jgi:hypothetical protein